MADTEVWAQSTNKLFQLEDSDRETNQLSVQVFGTNAFLNYEIKWPLNLIVSRDQIEKYLLFSESTINFLIVTTLFYCFSRF